MSSKKEEEILLILSSEDDEECDAGGKSAPSSPTPKRKRCCLSDDDSDTNSSQSEDGKGERDHESFWSISSDDKASAPSEGRNRVVSEADLDDPMTLSPHAGISATGGRSQDSIVREEDLDHCDVDENHIITYPLLASQSDTSEPDSTKQNGDSAESKLRDLVDCLEEDFSASHRDSNASDCSGSQQADSGQSTCLLDTAATSSELDRFRVHCGPEAHFLDENQRKPKKDQLVLKDPGNEFYGMPAKVRRAISEVYGIGELHAWQQDMLTQHISLAEGKRNALVHAPTSGGKTLVALILLLRTMYLEKKDGILVLPYVAIVTEKVQELKVLASKVGFFTVAEYAASKGIFPIPKQRATLRTLYVCTPEKASIAWRSLCGDRINEIGLVAVDECHMISDGARGSVVEELFVSILKWASESVTLLALSATIGNVEAFRVFLGGGRSSRCVLYDVHNRPTAIQEYLLVSGMTIPIVRDGEGKGTVSFTNRGPEILDDKEDTLILQCKAIEGNHEDAVVAKLVMQCMKREESALVFCGTRKLCITMCQMLTAVHQALESDEETDKAGSDLLQELRNQRELLIGHLQSESKERVDSTLLAGIREGIAFHSAELHPTERSAVEDAFKRGILSVLCCTTTLAAGVNLPCSRVIIRSPWIGNRFLSCAQYLQMSGRAGRTGLKAKGGSIADCYVLLQPNDTGRFQQLVEQHVESLTSQLGLTPSHYIRSRPLHGSSVHQFSGLTRVLLHALSVDKGLVDLSQLLDLYRLTMHYQSGIKCQMDGKETVFFTHGPILTELQRLLECGHVKIVVPGTDELNKIKLTVKTSTFVEPSRDSQSMEHEDTDLKELTPELVEAFTSALTAAMQEPEKTAHVVNYVFTLSPIARASSAASLEVSDAEKFMEEAQDLQQDMSLKNPFTFLYLSLTAGICKPLMEDPQYREKENTKNARIIGKVLASNFDLHPDARALKRIGLDSETLMEWVVGNPVFRMKSEFNEKLSRVWTALFLKELIAHPDNADQICVQYGFDRSMSIELSAVLASRLQNLKSLCKKMDVLWWYPPLATHIGKLLGPECTQDVRPLLVLRHVTIERAKKMFQIGLTTVQDVAQVYPPTLLSDKVPHTSRWMAVEIVLHARMLVEEEASLFEAESRERRRLLH